MHKISISILFLLCSFNCTAQTFIQYDSIPLVLTDSVSLFNRERKAVKDFRKNDKLYFAALNPQYPMAMTLKSAYRIIQELPIDKRTGEPDYSKIKCFKTTRGMIEHCVTYKVLVGKDTILIDSPEKFREVFAPVESEQEAIAFAYYFTDAEPIYNLNFLKQEVQEEKYFYTYNSINNKTDSIKLHQAIEKEWAVYLPSVSSSYVKKTDDGYELLLYYYKGFGCSHPYIEQIIKVYTNG